MLWINPRNVTINGEALGGVRSVRVSRGAGRSVVEHGDEGPHVVFVDVPEQKVEVRIERDLEDGAAVGAGVSDSVTLEFETSRGSSDALRRRVTIVGVVVSSDVDIKGESGGSERMKIIGVSSDGSQDPVVIEDVVA